MATLGVVDNAIAWAQLRLRGGWRGVMTVTISFAVVVALGMVLSIDLASAAPSTVYSYWMSGLLGFQMLLLVLMAPGRAGAAIRADLTSRVIESHRLMPVPAAEAIIGYLLGPNVTGIALAAATLVLGGAAASGAGIRLDRWLLANALVAIFGAFIGAAVTFFALAMKNAGAVVFAAVMIVGFSRGLAAEIAPGVLVLCGPFIRKTVFSMQAGSDLPWAYCVSVLGELVIGGLYFIAAARRYRRGDILGFSPIMGLGLLAAWIAVSGIGIAFWDDFRLFMFGDRYADAPSQLIASAALGLLLALVPLSAVARQESIWRFHRLLRSPSAGKRPMPGLLIVVVTAAMVLMLTGTALWIAGGEERIARTAIVCISFLTTAYFLLRIVYRRSATASGLVTYWILWSWVLPPLVALITQVLDRFGSDMSTGSFAIIASFSPIGALIEIWHGTPSTTTWGLVAQAACAAAAAMLFLRTKGGGTKTVAQGSVQSVGVSVTGGAPHRV